MNPFQKDEPKVIAKLRAQNTGFDRVVVICLLVLLLGVVNGL